MRLLSDLLLSSTLKHKQANQSAVSASSDQGLTTIETPLQLECFGILVIFGQVVRISSSSWLNVLFGALLN